MHKILSCTITVIVASIAIGSCYKEKTKIVKATNRDRITCWQNHAFVDLPIQIPAHYSEAEADELRASVCLEYFGSTHVVTPPID